MTNKTIPAGYMCVQKVKNDKLHGYGIWMEHIKNTDLYVKLHFENNQTQILNRENIAEGMVKGGYKVVLDAKEVEMVYINLKPTHQNFELNLSQFNK